MIGACLLLANELDLVAVATASLHVVLHFLHSVYMNKLVNFIN